MPNEEYEEYENFEEKESNDEFCQIYLLNEKYEGWCLSVVYSYYLLLFLIIYYR